MDSDRDRSKVLTYSSVERDIMIEVQPEFVPAESEPRRNNFTFSYKVLIQNLGSETVQLLNRHWKVFSGGRQIADVKGEGVVGHQPIIRPEMNFEYSSWTVIENEVGKMSGTYTFKSETGEFFDVAVPTFDLFDANEADFH